MPAPAATAATATRRLAQPASLSYIRRRPEDSLVRQVFVEQWPRLQRELREANDGRGVGLQLDARHRQAAWRQEEVRRPTAARR